MVVQVRITQAVLKEFIKKRGRIASIHCQYSRNAWDFHQPCTITTSGWTPLRGISVQPLMRKACPGSSGRPADFQTWLQHFSIVDFIRTSQPPWSVLYAQRGAPRGAAAFTDV